MPLLTYHTAGESHGPAVTALVNGLPAGLELRGLPAALESQLPNPGQGRKRVVVDDDVLLIETRTGRVLDILTDVFGGN